MLDLTQPPATDPTRIYRYRDGLYAVDLLTAAVVHLDLFTWLGREPASFAEIRGQFVLAARPADVLLTLCAANGLITRRGGLIHATDLAKEHLSRDSAWNIIDYYASLGDRPVCRDMLAVLRSGRPANWSSAEENEDWHRGMETEGFARAFTAAMDCRGAYLGQSLAAKWSPGDARHVLDIGGGSGIYACSLVARHPGLRATVFEKAPVDQICRDHLQARGFSDRVSVVAGDMFQDAYPADCDVHLLSNVLHDWDVPEVQILLAKSFATLPPGGQIIVHEAFLNREKTGPLPVAEYSAILMHSTQGKCYSICEMESLLAEAGFRGLAYADNAVDRGYFTAHKPQRERWIEVSVEQQRMRLREEERVLAEYAISTAKNGVGMEEGSEKTPLGQFEICQKIGHEAEPGTVFQSREPQGLWHLGEPSEDDLILSRILWLHGLEDQNANTRGRYIYIHGTNQEERIGQPASHGCIRMRNEDVIDLFARVDERTSVRILA